MIAHQERLAGRLAALLGADAVRTVAPDAGGESRWAVDGLTPGVVARPPDAEGVAAALRVCGELRAAVIPWGGGTSIDVGNPPRAADVVLLTERLSRIVDHDHANLTVTVEAGAHLGALAAVLAERGQWLALEPPLAEEASVGGAAAVGLAGPRRTTFGSSRDLAIGVRAALPNGSVIKWGGKTVKNVAGYDMAKLFVGSLGTLGVMTELTLKVSPLPEVARTVTAWAKSVGGAAALAERVLASPLLPSAVTVVNPAAMGGRAGVLIRAEGIEAAVERHQRDLIAWAVEAGCDPDVLPGDRERTAWTVLRDAGWGDGEAAVRLSVRAGRVSTLLPELEAALPSEVKIVAHVAAGTVWIAAPPEQLAPALPGLREAAQRHDGHLLLARAPRALKAQGDVWFPTPAALSVMRGFKQAFDPHGILNPGRFVAGL